MRMAYAYAFAYGIRFARLSVSLERDERRHEQRRRSSTCARTALARARNYTQVARAEPRADRRGGHRTGRRRRSGCAVDGTAGRTSGLRHHVALPACGQQGRTGGVHALGLPWAAAVTARLRLAPRTFRLGRRPVGG